MKNGPDIFNYRDYRSYLKDFIAYKKSQNRNYSLAMFARLIGVKNKSTLAMCLNGSRPISKEMSSSLISYLNLDGEQKTYFERLVIADIILKNSTDNSIASDIIKTNKPIKRAIIKESLLEKISTPLHFCIREMVHLKRFKNDPHWIKSNLKYHFSEEVITEAVKTLKDSGLIPNDKEENPPANISSSDEISSKAIRNLHSETLLTCIQALQNTTVEERYFSTITLNINPIDIPRIKNFIRKFEDEFEKEFETKPGEEVYSLNINFIPMTKKD